MREDRVSFGEMTIVTNLFTNTKKIHNVKKVVNEFNIPTTCHTPRGARFARFLLSISSHIPMIHNKP